MLSEHCTLNPSECGQEDECAVFEMTMLPLENERCLGFCTFACLRRVRSAWIVTDTVVVDV